MTLSKTVTRATPVATLVVSLLASAVMAGDIPSIGEPVDGIPEGYMIIEGDIIVPIDYEQQLATGCWRPLLWPSGRVPYEFHSNVSDDNRDRAIEAMGEWEAVAGVDFVPRAGESAYILIQNATSNSAGVGWANWEKYVNIRDWHNKFTIVHELGHVLGLWHEQSRVDRDDYVEIVYDNIQEDEKHNFGPHTPDDPYFTGYPFGPYDFASIMHYRRNAAAEVTVENTINVLPPFEYWQTRIGNRAELSFVDKLTMSNMYPDRETTPFTGEKWDPNEDGHQLSIADFSYMLNRLMMWFNPQPIRSNTYSWEYDGWENPVYPDQPTFGDLLQFSLYFLTGETSKLLTAPNPVQPDAESDLSVVLPSPLTLTGSGSQTFSIGLKNDNSWEDIYVWMVTVPLELPWVLPMQGTVTCTFSDRFIAENYKTIFIDVMTTFEGPADEYLVLFIHDLQPDPPAADPVRFRPGEIKELCRVTIDWDLSWGSVPVTFDQFTRPPAFVPVTSTSKTKAGVPEGGTYATLLPAIYQSLWEPVYEGKSDYTAVIAEGSFDVDDIVALVSCISTPGDDCNWLEAGRGDVNCSGMIDIEDAVYLVNHIFSAGPAPYEDCSGTVASYDKGFVGSAELAVVDNSEEEGSLLISTDTDAELQALQLEFSLPDEKCEINVESLIPGVGVYCGESERVFRIGVIDPYGEHMIPTGKTDILSLDCSGCIVPVLKDYIVVAKGGGHVETHTRLSRSSAALPERCILEQNYPNPFNPITEISFSLPTASHVKLEIFNIMGQRVAAVVDQHFEAGYHSATWDGSRAASGIYLYKIQTGDFVDTKKMVLLK